MILILMIIALLFITTLFSTSSGSSSFKNTLESESSQKHTKNKPSTPRTPPPDALSYKQRVQAPTPTAPKPLSNNSPNASSTDSSTFRATLRKSAENTLDVPTNTTNASHILSEGLTHAANKRELDRQNPERAADIYKLYRKYRRASANTIGKCDNDFYKTVSLVRATITSLTIAPELGWLDFPKLPVSRGITHAYTIGYRFKDMKHDMWTSRFNNFKYGELDAIKGATAMLQYAVFHLLKMRFSSIDPDKILFIPALSSREEKADPERPMCQITQRCAVICNASYSDTVLSKNAHRPIHKLSTAQERKNELDKAQYKSKTIEEEHIFIFDDIITRGDTLSHIACAILEENPHCTVYGIGLAKAESLSYSPYLNNNIIPEKWDTEWKNNSYIPS